VPASAGEWAWFAVEAIALALLLIINVRGAAKKKNER
jgi:amino acid transporter